MLRDMLCMLCLEIEGINTSDQSYHDVTRMLIELGLHLRQELQIGWRAERKLALPCRQRGMVVTRHLLQRRLR